jgi:hypothetical protein
LGPIAASAKVDKICIQFNDEVNVDDFVSVMQEDFFNHGIAAVSSQVSAPESVIGEWRGQTQFQGAQDAQLIEDAYTVVSLALTFSADGKVSGINAANGCAFLGLWAPGGTPRLFSLDVTLSGCRYAGFNRRYTGTLIATFPENSAQIALQADKLPISGIPVRRFDVGATLRR